MNADRTADAARNGRPREPGLCSGLLQRGRDVLVRCEPHRNTAAPTRRTSPFCRDRDEQAVAGFTIRMHLEPRSNNASAVNLDRGGNHRLIW